MGFSCPLPGRTGFNASYGTKSSDVQLTCNYPGADFDLAFTGGSGVAKPRQWIIVTLVVMMLVLI
jgi:calcium channel MID1